MQEETFIFDGKKHVSLDGSITYLGVERWFLDELAKYLWNEHWANLRWREVGTEKFIAFIDEKKAHIEGDIESPLSIRIFSNGAPLPKKFKMDDVQSLEETVGDELIRITFS
ncbi:hypothetical protein A9K97_gp338 [Tokyovirus A1]|uniref:hypothetical protein n=1 Tax=Tokyovirus A1 TaxID=1826170 RepID=UPI0007A991F3|nr:hypothetical protein A9K97_gp338 [Tokyovirus A1]BAU80013.1 hypothetical protein [Tokyovirus A1]